MSPNWPGRCRRSPSLCCHATRSCSSTSPSPSPFCRMQSCCCVSPSCQSCRPTSHSWADPLAWLRLGQNFSLELSVSILHGAQDTYTKGVKLGVKLEVNSPSNITSGLYIIGALPWTACSSCCGSWSCTRAWPWTLWSRAWSSCRQSTPGAMRRRWPGPGWRCSVRATLWLSSESQQFRFFPSFLKFVCCLVKEGMGMGEVEVMMVVGIAIVLSW